MITTTLVFILLYHYLNYSYNSTKDNKLKSGICALFISLMFMSFVTFYYGYTYSSGIRIESSASIKEYDLVNFIENEDNYEVDVLNNDKRERFVLDKEITTIENSDINKLEIIEINSVGREDYTNKLIKFIYKDFKIYSLFKNRIELEVEDRLVCNKIYINK